MEFTVMVLVFNLLSFQECPTWGIRIGLLICSFTRQIFTGQKLFCTGPDAGHTAVNITDVALAFVDQTGLAKRARWWPT